MYNEQSAGARCDVTAAGCEDPVLPAGVTFRRDAGRGVMMCDDDSYVHQYVVCDDNRWIGDVPDCSHDVGDSNSLGNFHAHIIIITFFISKKLARAT